MRHSKLPGRFSVVPYPEDKLWIIVDKKTGKQISYHLNQVEADTVVYCAHVCGLLDWELDWEQLDDDAKSNLLNWFEKKFFMSSYFGKLLLADIYEELSNSMTEEE